VGNATAGIATCGRRESNDGTKIHESCCRSLALPGTAAVRLDKYEVTAGRMRQFIETAGPNLRQWAATEIANDTPVGKRLAADIPVPLRSLLPATADVGQPMNLVMQIGGTVMDARRPSASQGCYSDDGAYGHNTYYWPEGVLDGHFGASHAARRFTKEQYDEKAMNCSPYWVYAAFCAWDGGRLPTMAEINQVWTATYPWGGAYGAPGPVAPASGVDYETTIDQGNNTLFFYAYPAFGNAHDIAGYIAAPGRFFRDATATKSNGESWMDLGANMMEMLQIDGPGMETFCDFNVFAAAGDVTSPQCTYTPTGGTARPGVLRATSMPEVPWVGGSWEGHAVGKPTYHFGAQVQYGKTGFRCAR
jgi:hypothetical protein